jgi:hypothetical protein
MKTIGLCVKTPGHLLRGSRPEPCIVFKFLREIYIPYYGKRNEIQKGHVKLEDPR